LRIFPTRRLFLSGFVLALLLLDPRPAFPADSPPANPHAYFQQPAQCTRCHLYTGSKPDPDRIAASSVEFCQECHRPEERRRTHPLKVQPAGRSRDTKIPPEYRLGDGEHLICLTCHSAHGPYASTVRAFAGQQPMNAGEAGAIPYYKTFFLRRSNPEAKGFETLCAGCHKAP
jgi:predicted CXXCH cytochrome family protein